jgi:hypothetical protein
MEGARGHFFSSSSPRRGTDVYLPTARRLLKSMTIKQGIKFDSPESARDIVPFIQFHRLNIEEFLDPVESFRMPNL